MTLDGMGCMEEITGLCHQVGISRSTYYLAASSEASIVSFFTLHLPGFIVYLCFIPSNRSVFHLVS